MIELECFAGSGASGSVFASRTGFVTDFEAEMVGLSTDFFSACLAGAAAVFAGSFAVDLAAARPGLSADLDRAGFAAVTGLSADFDSAGRGIWAAVFAGTSRVSVLRLAS